MPQITIWRSFTFIYLRVFFNFSRAFFFDSRVILKCDISFPRAWRFSLYFLLWISDLVPLWSKNTVCISFRFVGSFSSPRMLMAQCTVCLGAVLCTHGNGVFWCWVKCSVESIGASWLVVLSSYSSSLFSLGYQERDIEVSNCRNWFVCFPLSSVSFCLVYFSALLFGTYAFRIAVPSWWTTLLL